LALSGTSASAGSTLRGRDVDNEGNVDLLADAKTATVNWRSLQDEDQSTPSPVVHPIPIQDVCSNGIPGIQTGNACCIADCGACGG
ncbi:unnamed protein product, partial [Ectocarpus fasciculatus]